MHKNYNNGNFTTIEEGGHLLAFHTYGWVFIQSWVLYGNTLYLWPQVPHPSSGIPGEFQIRNTNSGFAHCAGFTGRSMVDLKDQVFICTFYSF